MKRIVKNPNSEILTLKLTYKKNNSVNNKKIAEILLKEQKCFCAYSQEYFGINDADDIEHFNPNFKYTKKDSYHNWFLVKHKVNKKKGEKWTEPILHPTSEDFEERLIYKDGLFFYKIDDIETKNLIDLLDLNNKILVEFRRNYIKRRKERIIEKNFNPLDYFVEIIKNEINTLKYLRAIQEEFKINIWEMIP